MFTHPITQNSVFPLFPNSQEHQKRVSSPKFIFQGSNSSFPSINQQDQVCRVWTSIFFCPYDQMLSFTWILSILMARVHISFSCFWDYDISMRFKVHLAQEFIFTHIFIHMNNIVRWALVFGHKVSWVVKCTWFLA